MFFVIGLAGIASLLCPGYSRAETRLVPSQYATIQEALDACAARDTVQVAPGVYPEMLVWPAVEGIELVAESGPWATRIGAAHLGRVITIDQPAASPVTIRGFSLTDGQLSGAMADSFRGAGLLARGIELFLDDVRIASNAIGGSYSPFGQGGGIFVEDCTLVVTRSRIINNTIQSYLEASGGGIFLLDSTARITSSVISSNSVDSGEAAGGAIAAFGDQLIVLDGNTVEGNFSSSVGGAVLLNCPGEIINNIFGDNSFYGLTLWCNPFTVSFNTFNANVPWTLAVSGGGRIAANIIVDTTGGVMSDSGSNIELLDNNFWEVAEPYWNTSPGQGDFMEDPDYGPGYRLRPGSPCIDRTDAGDTDHDFEGQPRPQGLRSDVGADEYAGEGTPPPTTPTMHPPTETPAPTMTHAPTETPTPEATSAPTATPTPEETSAPTATPTPEPTDTPLCPAPGVELVMPAVLFQPGDTCWLRAAVCNQGPDALDGYLFILLETAGEFFALPQLLAPYPEGITSLYIVPAFVWPAAGTGDARFWSVLFTPGLAVYGGFGWCEFQWRE